MRIPRIPIPTPMHMHAASQSPSSDKSPQSGVDRKSLDARSSVKSTVGSLRGQPERRSKRHRAQKALKLKPDQRWLEARKELLQDVKAQVAARLGIEPSDLKVYRKRYERELAKSWKESTKGELLEAIESSDLVYGGDFHALGQSQRTHLRILRSLSMDRPVALGLECFPRNTQKWLDLFTSGGIDCEELRRRSRWEKSWGFPWDHYRPLLELARSRGFRLLALNEPAGAKTHDRLDIREARAAKVLAEYAFRNPGTLVYVIFGDLHLANAHLPKLVKEKLRLRNGSKRKPYIDLVIHVNPEKVYFELALQGLELSVEVIKWGPRRFGVLSTPPWVQWQSYLLYLDRATDEDLNRDEDDEQGDPTDQIVSLIQVAASDLDLRFKINDLSVYGPDDNDVWRTLERRMKPKDRGVARALLASGRSFYLPGDGTGYLARATINHAAALAGSYIHAKMNGQRRPLWNPPRDFSAMIWTEATAYFISKLINHKRRSETFVDLRAELASAIPGDQGREALKLALDRSLSEALMLRQGRRRASKFKPRRKSSYFEASRILGGMMGERLYLAYRARKISNKDIAGFMRFQVDESSLRSTGRKFEHHYFEILKRLGDESVALSLSRRERL